jgi:hypothetical protein
MKAHPFDALSFIFGVLLLGIGLLVAAGESASQVSAWLPPTVIIGLGALLLFAGWQSSRTGDEDPSAADPSGGSTEG